MSGGTASAKRTFQRNKDCAFVICLCSSNLRITLLFKTHLSFCSFSLLQNTNKTALSLPSGYKLAFNYLKARRFVDAIDICHHVSQMPLSCCFSCNFFLIFTDPLSTGPQHASKLSEDQERHFGQSPTIASCLTFALF